MKQGDIVAVCHDGKWGRRTKGEVIATRRGHHIKVRFYLPDEDVPVEFWARKIPAVRYKRRHGEFKNMWDMDHKPYFAGWSDIDYWCPWFAVHKWKE